MVRGSSPQPFYSDVFICDYKCTELCDPPLWRGQAGRILAESSCVGRGSGRADRADPQLCGVRTDDRAVPGRGHVLLGHDERALCRLRRRDPGTVPGEPREVEGKYRDRGPAIWRWRGGWMGRAACGAYVLRAGQEERLSH